MTNIGASNGLLRQYFPQGTVITDHRPYLTAIAEELSERPRATLGFLTPREAFERLLVASTPSHRRTPWSLTGQAPLLFAGDEVQAGLGEDFEAEVAASFGLSVVLFGEHGPDQADDTEPRPGKIPMPSVRRRAQLWTRATRCTGQRDRRP